MKKTNLEALKELKDFEVAQVIRMLDAHVLSIQMATGAAYNLDAVDDTEDGIGIVTSWLNDSFDEEKGFKFYLSGKAEYITKENLSQYDYLEDTHQDYSEYFDSDEDEEDEEDE